MSSDQLFHKARAKSRRDLRRAQSSRKPVKRILISCEGTKTEPNYIKKLMNHMEIKSYYICDHKGTDPMTVVNTALNHFKEDSDYDGIFCIFDKDQHPELNYNGAIGKLESFEKKQGNQKKKFLAVISVPCFELWFLLHFDTYTKPADKADDLISDLKKKSGFSDYKKGDGDHFDQLIGKLDDAKKNAEIIFKQAEATGTDNPTTKMHEFIRHLEGIVAEATPEPKK